MQKFWTEEEIEFLREWYPAEGAELCAEVLDRTLSSVQHKASRLKIKDTYRWLDSELKLLNKYYPINGAKYCASIINKTIDTIQQKASRLKLKHITSTNKLKSDVWYLNKIKDLDIISLETYIGTETKILHKHSKCGYEWLVTPHKILAGRGCPACKYKNAKQLYFIYFEELNLYKVGVTNNYKRRLKEFGHTPELISLKEYKTAKEAYEEEQYLLSKLPLVNTGELNSGNTETFRFS